MPPAKPLDDFSFRAALLKLGVVFALCVVGFMQTEFFVSYYKATDHIAVQREMKQCADLQARLATEAKRIVKNEVVYMLWDDSPTQLKLVKDATESLLNDAELQKELRDKFGVSFLDIGVVVLPSWQIFTDSNNDLVGITAEGWQQGKKVVGKTDVPGFTLHDQPRSKPKTKDGRPRVVLNPKAFQSIGVLRLTLLHELLHAINVPGVDPWPPTFAQNDLSYLPEYRSLIRRKGLAGWNEQLIWILGVLVPAVIFARLARRTWLYRQARQALR